MAITVAATLLGSRCAATYTRAKNPPMLSTPSRSDFHHQEPRGSSRHTARSSTPAGRALIDRAFTEHMRNERTLLDALPPADAAHLEALLTAWLSHLEPPARG